MHEPTNGETTTMQRLSTLLMLSLAAVLVAGCGGSSSSSSSSSSGQSTSTTPSTSAATTATSSPPTTSTGTQKATDPAVTKSAIRKLAERSCKSQIQADLALTSTEKASIEKLCSKAADQLGAANGVTQQICAELVKHSALPGTPNTPARKQALAACKSAK